MQSPRHITKDKGDLALTKVIANLREHGIISCLPLSEHLPFDLIAVMPDMMTLIRIQVKYRSGTQTGMVKIEFRNNYYDSHKIYSKPVNFSEIDAYAVYVPDNDSICYFRVSDLPDNARTLSLRFVPPKNNQRKGINLVEDFLNPYAIADQIYPKYDEPMNYYTNADEIAIAKFAVYLQENSYYVLYPNSQLTPFDLLGISADTQIITRYIIRSDDINYSAYADSFVVYQRQCKQPHIISGDELKQSDTLL